MFKDYFLLALKNLKRRGVRSWLTLLGIFIGITAVISLITLGSGLRTAVNSQFGVDTTQMISVQAGGLTGYGPPGTGVVNPLTVQDVEEIEKLSTVERAVRRNVPTCKIEFKNEVVFSIAVSIPDGSDRDFVYEAMGLEIEEGRFLRDGDSNSVMLGYNFYAKSAGLNNLIRSGNTILIKDEKFEVKGILAQQGSFLFDNSIYMNENALEELTGFGDNVDVIAVKVRDKDLMDKAKEEIESLLRKRRAVKSGEEDFEVSTPEAMLSTVNGVLAGIQAFVVLIASLSIVVGAIGIVNTMGTSVVERTKEIGIMKAIGAKNSDIFFQFLVEAGLMGLVGGILGAILGVNIGILGTLGINNFIGATSRPQISLSLIIGSLIGSFVIGGVAGIAPAMKAARQHPVEALRK